MRRCSSHGHTTSPHPRPGQGCRWREFFCRCTTAQRLLVLLGLQPAAGPAAAHTARACAICLLGFRVGPRWPKRRAVDAQSGIARRPASGAGTDAGRNEDGEAAAPGKRAAPCPASTPLGRLRGVGSCRQAPNHQRPSGEPANTSQETAWRKLKGAINALRQDKDSWWGGGSVVPTAAAVPLLCCTVGQATPRSPSHSLPVGDVQHVGEFLRYPSGLDNTMPVDTMHGSICSCTAHHYHHHYTFYGTASAP